LPTFTWDFGDFHVAVYPDEELAAQIIDLFGSERADVLGNGVQAGARLARALNLAK
jgi:hypothetical protein